MRDEGHQVQGQHGVVAAESEAVARAGARMLEAGGNAFDAAAAACLACSMVHPDKCGVGGYLLAGVVIEGASGQVWSLDANARAPAAAYPGMYDVRPARAPGTTPAKMNDVLPDGAAARTAGLNEMEYDCSVRDDANVHGGLAVAVPGQMAGMGLLHERWGRLPWGQVVQPALDLLDDGIPVGDYLAGSLRNLEPVIRRFPDTAAHLLVDGRVPEAGTIWHRPGMERALERLAVAGWRDFYEGELAGAIVDAVQATGGVLTRADLAAFEPGVTPAHRSRYRDAEVFGAILPNGTLSVQQALNMLAAFDPVSADEVLWWHRTAEVLKRVWRDRLACLADPEHAAVPVERLLSPDYARGRVEALLQAPDHADTRPFASGGGVPETSHVSTADAEGNVVSATITHGAAFGANVTVPGWGLILGHGMCRLDPRPGRPNSVAAGKRPLNNVMTMVLRTPERDIALGMPGGRRIISVGTQMVQRLVDHGATGAAAARAPRLHVLTAEPVELQDTAADELAAGLTAMGHTVRRVPRVGGHAAAAEALKGGGPKGTGGGLRAGGGGWAVAI